MIKIPHSRKARYRRLDVGRKGHHFLQVVYEGDKLVEAKLKPYKGSDEKEIMVYPKKR